MGSTINTSICLATGFCSSSSIFINSSLISITLPSHLLYTRPSLTFISSIISPTNCLDGGRFLARMARISPSSPPRPETPSKNSRSLVSKNPLYEVH